MNPSSICCSGAPGTGLGLPRASGNLTSVLEQIRCDTYSGTRTRGSYTLPDVRLITVGKGAYGLPALRVDGKEVGLLHGDANGDAALIPSLYGPPPGMITDLNVRGHFANSKFYIDHVDGGMGARTPATPPSPTASASCLPPSSTASASWQPSAQPGALDADLAQAAQMRAMPRASAAWTEKVTDAAVAPPAVVRDATSVTVGGIKLPVRGA